MIYYKFLRLESIYYFCEIDYVFKTEQWKDVVGFEGIYQVSDLGRIKSLQRKTVIRKIHLRNINEKIIKPILDKDGYPKVSLYYSGKSKSKANHRCVLESFLGYNLEKDQVNHKNGIKIDNRLINLEWCTRAENSQHASKTGLNNPLKGEKHKLSKLKNEDILKIREMRKNGISCIKISNIFNLNRATVHKIISRKQWKHI